MVSSNKLSIHFLLTVLLVSSGFAEEPKIETPFQLVDVFYKMLVSSTPSEELPQIFSEPLTFVGPMVWPDQEKMGKMDETSATKLVWDYFRAYKDALLFPTIDPPQTFSRASKAYCFEAFPNEATFFEGMLCVELSIPLKYEDGERVAKQVRFSIEKNKRFSGPRYLIVASLVSVNGVFLAPGTKAVKPGNLYKELGFEVESQR